MVASPLILRRSGRAATAVPQMLRSGLAKMNASDSTGTRSVSFASLESIPVMDADPHELTPAQRRTGFAAMDTSTAFDADNEVALSTTMTSFHRCAATHSTPLSGFRELKQMGKTAITPIGESQEFVGAQSMPMSNFLKRSSPNLPATDAARFATAQPTPLSGFRELNPTGLTTAVIPARESQQFVVGAQSMPLTNFLKRSSQNVAATDAVEMHPIDATLDDFGPVDELRIGRAHSTPQVDNTKTSAVSGREKISRRKTVSFGAHLSPELKVVVVAPGGGTGMNAGVYSKLSHQDDISLQIVGQSRAQYDRYTEAWGAPSGGPAPNLESFAMDLSSQGALEHCDCLVVGSRGGQVCLPTFWRMKGAEVPPVVVLNGGCAMELPIQVPWPDNAVTFLLLGGQDYFRQQLTIDQYLADAKRRVPHGNCTTAIMLVQEMAHMPQAQLLDAILHSMIKAVTEWKEDFDATPIAEFQKIVTAVHAIGFHATLTYKTGPGDAWDITNSARVTSFHRCAATRSTPLSGFRQLN